MVVTCPLIKSSKCGGFAAVARGYPQEAAKRPAGICLSDAFTNPTRRFHVANAKNAPADAGAFYRADHKVTRSADAALGFRATTATSDQGRAENAKPEQAEHAGLGHGVRIARSTRSGARIDAADAGEFHQNRMHHCVDAAGGAGEEPPEAVAQHQRFGEEPVIVRTAAGFSPVGRIGRQRSIVDHVVPVGVVQRTRPLDGIGVEAIAGGIVCSVSGNRHPTVVGTQYAFRTRERLVAVPVFIPKGHRTVTVIGPTERDRMRIYRRACE